MNERIRKEALRAAAKVALALTPLAACGGTTLETPSVDGNGADDGRASQTADPGSSEDSLVTADAAPRKRRDGGGTTTTTDADVESDAAVDAGLTDAEAANAAWATCNALLDSVSFVDDADLGEKIPITPETTACCEVELKTATARFTNTIDASIEELVKHMTGCCDLEWTIEPSYAKQPQWVHMACSPWGPPMPPAMVA